MAAVYVLRIFAIFISTTRSFVYVKHKAKTRRMGMYSKAAVRSAYVMFTNTHIIYTVP